ncbi:deoxyguanosinetriphosphate triphosphohydrolase family protein [Bythopirellula polymerisocia]|uniref:Deoxyguanosinetriphosphate triphosphohydrolase n=1 Tax=Bythopirellula polymerisocia TaxID=2528003 RepID=A0A5C6CRL8_9BACT|nr:dNTP triphosphohydrolase [Bythopirellula polymerisocia]TWU27563.1 Deoxyguanosinetriphosphate triphosphohydrolase [Bythopirellula polymerisocia]
MAEYDDRIWETGSDQRDAFARDRDRILYTEEFRRLAGVTQVVTPTEGQIFHNRLTHSLEVAQIARRLAERLRDDFQEESRCHDNVNPDVAEAAALAHDLGHPPFGHVAEKELDTLLVRQKIEGIEGYEGNAQSFRIATKLAVRFDLNRRNTSLQEFQNRKPDEFGLNLTRGTLNAILKYPWPRKNQESSEKWGVYESEQLEFDWVRKKKPEGKHQAVEAAIMDWADDIAYSVHDVEDFYRAGLIPLHTLAQHKEERDSFLDAVFKRHEAKGGPIQSSEYENLTKAFDEFFSPYRGVPITQPYNGSSAQRMSLNMFKAQKIGEFVKATKLTEDPSEPVFIDPGLRNQVTITKELVWQYVILNPALATQQHGYKLIVRSLFEEYLQASESGGSDLRIIPARFRSVIEYWNEVNDSQMPRHRLVRTVADAVASLTDNEAIIAFKRLRGISSGSVLDLLP